MSHYEVLPEMIEDGAGEAKLHASWTANNGIRIQIENKFDEEDRQYEQLNEAGWDNYFRVFDLTREQAKTLGEALLRWAADSH